MPEQNIDLQIDALSKAGCDPKYIFTDTVSGLSKDRPGLDKALSMLREGDTFVVYKLDRFARSTKHLIDTLVDFKTRGIEFMCIAQGMDTNTPAGRLMFTILAGIAEFERDLIHERTMAGLVAARRRGKVGGRKQTITDERIKQAIQLAETSELTIEAICKDVGISVNTYYRRRKEILKAKGSS
jgi:DNA invertase Pin-like site-specific DNA recombinase